ncbi:MAG: M18 family aminopeptidase [Anaeroplasmataceae bacterium]
MKNNLLKFLDESVSVYHAVENAEQILIKNGFSKLEEHSNFKIELGNKYYTIRNGSSIIAFTIPKKISNYSFNIIASHTDFPTFKLKPNFQIDLSNKYTTLNTEVYGGPIMASWMDRPLSIAGRVVFKDKDVVTIKNINIDKDLLVIPNMSIHLSKDINIGKKFNPQIDMLPLLNSDIKDKSNIIISLITNQLTIKEEDILSFDLYLYNRDKSKLVGANSDILLAPRIDNLECLHASLQSFLNTNNQSSINVFSSFDNEEVGSRTKQGAASNFLESTLIRINNCLGFNQNDLYSAFANSFFVSCDNAQGLHPNHLSMYDNLNNAYLNGGIVIKNNANQSYSTDAVSKAIFKSYVTDKKIKLQEVANRSDQLGGSTLGNIASLNVSMNMIDIGCPQLAMHSALETAGYNDYKDMISALESIYSKTLIKQNDNTYKIIK